MPVTVLSDLSKMTLMELATASRELIEAEETDFDLLHEISIEIEDRVTMGEFEKMRTLS